MVLGQPGAACGARCHGRLWTHGRQQCCEHRPSTGPCRAMVRTPGTQPARAPASALAPTPRHGLPQAWGACQVCSQRRGGAAPAPSSHGPASPGTRAPLSTGARRRRAMHRPGARTPRSARPGRRPPCAPARRGGCMRQIVASLSPLAARAARSGGCMDRRGIGTPYPYPAMRAAELSALHCGRSPGGRASGGRMTCSLVSAAPACTLQYRDRAMQHAAGPTRSGRPVGERGSGGAPAAPPGTGACSRTAAPGPAGTRPAGTARAHGPGRSAARRPPASRAAAAPAPSPYRSAAQGRALSAAIARRGPAPRGQTA